MEIKNQQIFTCGKGEQSYQMYFTIDLIPISVVFKYDFIESKSSWFNISTGKNEFVSISKQPRIIENLFTREIYQQIIDLVCDRLNLEKRTILCLKETSLKNSFNFSKDEYFYEFQYYGNFGRCYCVETKLHNALKYWDELKKVIHRNSDDEFYFNEMDEFDRGFYSQFIDLRNNLNLQGVFKYRDHHYISDKTMDNFIDNLAKKSKRIKKETQSI